MCPATYIGEATGYYGATAGMSRNRKWRQHERMLTIWCLHDLGVGGGSAFRLCDGSHFRDFVFSHAPLGDAIAAQSANVLAIRHTFSSSGDGVTDSKSAAVAILTRLLIVSYGTSDRLTTPDDTRCSVVLGIIKRLISWLAAR
jgi:hypothetical protein